LRTCARGRHLAGWAARPTSACKLPSFPRRGAALCAVLVSQDALCARCRGLTRSHVPGGRSQARGFAPARPPVRLPTRRSTSARHLPALPPAARRPPDGISFGYRRKFHAAPARSRGMVVCVGRGVRPNYRCVVTPVHALVPTMPAFRTWSHTPFPPVCLPARPPPRKHAPPQAHTDTHGHAHAPRQAQSLKLACGQVPTKHARTCDCAELIE
jgi:hypothetical protein